MLLLVQQLLVQQLLLLRGAGHSLLSGLLEYLLRLGTLLLLPLLLLEPQQAGFRRVLLLLLLLLVIHLPFWLQPLQWSLLLRMYTRLLAALLLLLQQLLRCPIL